MSRKQAQAWLAFGVVLVFVIIGVFAALRAEAAPTTPHANEVQQTTATVDSTRIVIGHHANPLPVFPPGYWHPLKHTLKKHGNHYDAHVLYRTRRQVRYAFRYKNWRWRRKWIVRLILHRWHTWRSPWRTAVASQYGSGSEAGQGLAGGGRLNDSMKIFAHKTMKFGTVVEFVYHGRRVRAKCKDRGPYVAGRTFDFSPGTARALGFDGVGTVCWRIIKTRHWTITRYRAKYEVK